MLVDRYVTGRVLARAARAVASVSLPRGRKTHMPKRKRDGEGVDVLDEDAQVERDELEDAEMQQRLEERRNAENDRMRCAQNGAILCPKEGRGSSCESPFPPCAGRVRG